MRLPWSRVCALDPRGRTTWPRHAAGRRSAPALRRGRRRGARGTALVELALGSVLLLTLCLGTVDAGRGINAREDVSDAARQALRAAAAQASYGNSACSGLTGAFPQAVTVWSPIPYAAGGGASASIQGVANAAAAEAVGGTVASGALSSSPVSGAVLSVTFHCSAAGAVETNTTATTTDPSQLGSAAIEAQVCYEMNLLTPLGSALFGRRTCSHTTSTSGISVSFDATGRADY